MDKNIPIFDAINERNAELVSQILSTNPNLRVYDPASYEDTPLHLAIRTKQPEVVKLLLSHNCPVEARNKFDDTPLHLAAMIGNIDIVKLLLEYGADKQARNDNYKLAYDIALESGSKEIAELLK